MPDLPAPFIPLHRIVEEIDDWLRTRPKGIPPVPSDYDGWLDYISGGLGIAELRDLLAAGERMARLEAVLREVADIGDTYAGDSQSGTPGVMVEVARAALASGGPVP